MFSFAASLLIAAATGTVYAQTGSASGVVDGIVTDTNLVSLADATVSILGSKIQVVTGSNGRFRIRDVAAGQYIVVIHRLGYVPVSSMLQIAQRDTLRMSFTLRQIATALDTVVVAAKSYGMRMTEFEERRKLGFGQFMTQFEIEKRNSVYLSDLLQTFLSVGPGATNLRGGGTPGHSTCVFRFFLDGVAMPPSVRVGVDLPSPKELAGIEVYSGAATIPLQYKPIGSVCGVILLWTRDGS